MVQDPIEPSRIAGTPPLRSEFHDDPDMRGIVMEFLQQIPTRIAQLDSLVAEGNQSEFRRIIHQMKGAGGGYGFQEISNTAAQIETCMKLSGEQWCRDCHAHFHAFRSLLLRAHDGLKEMRG
jgi:HPt (histidine-containing phosphotransfer) domain-containing protein